MIYLSLVITLAVGYIIGLLQNGITVNVRGKGVEAPAKTNKSVGIQTYMDYYDDTGGENKF